MSLQKKYVLSLLFLLSILFAASCQKQGRDETSNENPKARNSKSSEILLQIGGHSFSKNIFFNYRKSLFEAMGIDSALGPAENTAILSKWIEDRLIWSAAKDDGLSGNKGEVEKLKKKLSLFDDDFKNITVEELLKQEYLNKKIGGKISVTEAEMKQYYRNHSPEFMASKVYHVKEILVSGEALAHQIRNELLGGGKSRFGAFAKQFSISPSAASGGDLGYFKQGELPLEFEKIIRKLKPGSFSKVIKTQYGYHIFYLEEVIRAHAQKFYEVKNRIRNMLRRRKERTALEDLIKKLYTRYSPILYTDQLDFDLERGIISKEIRLEAKHGL